MGLIGRWCRELKRTSAQSLFSGVLRAKNPGQRRRKIVDSRLKPMWSSIERARLPVRSGLIARHQAEEQQAREHVAGPRVADHVDRGEDDGRQEDRPGRRHATQQRRAAGRRGTAAPRRRARGSRPPARARRPRRRAPARGSSRRSWGALPLRWASSVIGVSIAAATSDSTMPASSQIATRAQPSVRSGRVRPKSASQRVLTLAPGHEIQGADDPGALEHQRRDELRHHLPAGRVGAGRERGRERGTARARRPRRSRRRGVPSAIRARRGEAGTGPTASMAPTLPGTWRAARSRPGTNDQRRHCRHTEVTAPARAVR